MLSLVAVGAHVSSSGGIFTAITRGEAIGAEAIQIFPSAPQTWRPTNHKPEAIARFRELHAASTIQQVWIHNIYLANLAADDPAMLEKSIDSVVNALTVADAIGALGVVLHTGSHKGQGLELVERQVCEALTLILERAPGSAVLALENAAGHGGVIGRTFGELGRLIQAVRHDRLQVCVDTCHAFAAGYDIADPDGLELALMEFDSTIGLERLAVLHANDSKLPLGSGRDRHENIGDGCIGVEGFRTLFEAEEFRGKAFLLEVPGIPDEHGKANGPDAENVRRLKQVRSGARIAVEGSSPTKRGGIAQTVPGPVATGESSEDDPPSPGTRPPSGGSRRAGGARRRPSE